MTHNERRERLNTISLILAVLFGIAAVCAVFYGLAWLIGPTVHAWACWTKWEDLGNICKHDSADDALLGLLAVSIVVLWIFVTGIYYSLYFVVYSTNVLPTEIIRDEEMSPHEREILIVESVKVEYKQGMGDWSTRNPELSFYALKKPSAAAASAAAAAAVVAGGAGATLTVVADSIKKRFKYMVTKRRYNFGCVMSFLCSFQLTHVFLMFGYVLTALFIAVFGPLIAEYSRTYLTKTITRSSKCK